MHEIEAEIVRSNEVQTIIKVITESSPDTWIAG